MLQYIDHIVLPYITKVGESLLALVIMDNFKDTISWKNVHVVYLPPNAPLSNVSNFPAFKVGSYPLVSAQYMFNAHTVHQNAHSIHFTLFYLYTVNKSAF